MALPRSNYVREGQEGVYHCFSRCVRRAFLYGFDALTHRDFSHRKAWLVDRLRHLSAIFAVEVCAYAVMENHYHTILRTRPDIVASWSDQEVATRWLTLFPRYCGMRGAALPPAEAEISALAHSPQRIAQLRQRLSSLSWFMGRLNEFIARAANKEDRVKGRFWEARFKCQALLDDAAIVACMVYVDLNPIRAGLARTPEESNFTSIQQRIRAWRKEKMPTTSVQDIRSDSFRKDLPIRGNLQQNSRFRHKQFPRCRGPFRLLALSHFIRIPQTWNPAYDCARVFRSGGQVRTHGPVGQTGRNRCRSCPHPPADRRQSGCVDRNHLPLRIANSLLPPGCFPICEILQIASAGSGSKGFRRLDPPSHRRRN